mmetsp:Transcript_101246/g.269190  ORF Transcript_101246/g.269190 Transcript_101246/m.269190 type:complete len:227 (+) Transcript_101246:1765-2445(+)
MDGFEQCPADRIRERHIHVGRDDCVRREVEIHGKLGGGRPLDQDLGGLLAFLAVHPVAVDGINIAIKHSQVHNLGATNEVASPVVVGGHEGARPRYVVSRAGRHLRRIRVNLGKDGSHSLRFLGFRDILLTHTSRLAKQPALRNARNVRPLGAKVDLLRAGVGPRLEAVEEADGPVAAAVEAARDAGLQPLAEPRTLLRRLQLGEGPGDGVVHADQASLCRARLHR